VALEAINNLAREDCVLQCFYDDRKTPFASRKATLDGWKTSFSNRKSLYDVEFYINEMNRK
jgi:hypothetical protein